MKRKLTLVRCTECHGPTTWSYAWKHEGRCPRCIDPELAAMVAAEERRRRILAAGRGEVTP